MNPETQAKNGFKTFVVTLSVSLVIFSALYYVINDTSSNVDIEEYQTSKDKTVAFETEVEDVKGTTTKSAFGVLANTPPTEEPQVLGGTDDTTTTDTTTTTEDETSESTVPETGTETLFGTMLAVGMFSIALYFIVAGPRKFALANFEDRATNQ